MSDMDEAWVTERSEAIGEYCRALIVSIGDSVDSGDLATAAESARELGGIVGKLGMRAYSLQMLAEGLLTTDPAVRAAYEGLVRDTRLPTE